MAPSPWRLPRTAPRTSRGGLHLAAGRSYSPSAVAMSYIAAVPHGLRDLRDRRHSTNAYPSHGLLLITEQRHEGDAGTTTRVWYRSDNVWWRARDGCARRDRYRSRGMSLYYSHVFPSQEYQTPPCNRLSWSNSVTEAECSSSPLAGA